MSISEAEFRETFQRRGSWLGRLALRWRKFMTHRSIQKGGMQSRYVQFEGLRQHYYHSPGSGPTLVLLHGFLDTAQTWRRVFRTLQARDFNVVALDVPGFGFTSLPQIRELWDLRRMAGMLARLVRFELKLENPILLTHSMGGLIGATMAEYMRRVYQVQLFSELHLIAPGMLRLKHHERDERRRLLYPRSREEVRLLIDTLYHEDIPDLPEIILDGLLREWSVPGYFYLAENTIDDEPEVFFTPARLRALKAPMALYWGDEDEVTPLTLARRMQRSVPGTQLEIFKQSGHALHVENAGELLERFLPLVGKLKGRSRRSRANQR